MFNYRACAVSALALAIVLPMPILAQDHAHAHEPSGAQDAARDPILTDVILVTAATRVEAVDTAEPPHHIPLPADTVSLAARTAGGGAVGNGALSGQLSYRGLFGERVLGRVNGQRFATGGPNAMDPPMHYAPSILVEALEIARGVAPVSQGPSLAGAVNARLVETGFASGEAVEASGYLAGQYRSADDSGAVGGRVGLATRDWRIGVIASREEGDDYRFADSRIAGGTLFERNLYGVHAGAKVAGGELFAEYRRSETDPSGNPPFALDIVYFDTDFLQGGWRGELAPQVALEVKAGHVAVRHLMDNVTLRRPIPAQQRSTFASADTFTADARLRFGTATRHIAIGADLEEADRFVRITDPTNANFHIDSQPDVEAQRIGGFVEARLGFGALEAEAGLRVDRTTQNAGVPTLGTAVPMGPRGLANAFIASAREASDTTLDAVMRVWVPGDEATPRLTLARKTRVPSVLERFAWLPTEASYGLADGNIYVGNQALKPEVAWIAEVGVDMESGGFTFRPTAFYRRVDDYIQGTPFDATPGVIDSTVEMVSSMNGDATPLMFRNVDAELFGIDADFSAVLAERVMLEGTASYVRGKRRDMADNLYRVPPLSARLAAMWHGQGWFAGAEVTAAAKQAKVSATNGETASGGYAMVNLFASLTLAPDVVLDAGIENLFDRFYQPHLAGLNRVGASDVPVGQRLPGAGRGVWVRTSLRF